MDRYRVAPRPVYLAGASPGGGHGQRHLHQLPPCGGAASGRRSSGAELDIFAAERYFHSDDVVKKKRSDDDAGADDVPAALPVAVVAVDAASQSGRTAASSEASWNSRSGLLSSHAHSSAAAAKLQRGGGGIGNGAVAAGGLHYHGGKKGGGAGSGQRWGLFCRDCPCAGRKAVTVDVASEPRSPVTPRINTRYEESHVMADSSIFKPKVASPPPAPCDEPATRKITPGSSTIFAVAQNKSGSTSASFAAFPPDIARRVVSSGGFTFPVGAGTAKAMTAVDEPPRESLEVFRPIDEDSVVLEEHPPPPSLALAVSRGGHAVAGFARAPGVAAVMDDDAMSDASSDLFDLESFAASSSYPTTYRGRGSRRNSGDDDLPYSGGGGGGGEPALSECMYAPSEVSVVWSVATADGGGAFDAASVANFSSAASACCVDEFRFVPPEASAAAAGGGHDGFTAAMSRSAGRKKSGGGGGFLNSCRCEKAVSVGPTPVRVVRQQAVPDVTSVKTGSHAMGLVGGAAARYHPGRVHMPVRT